MYHIIVNQYYNSNLLTHMLFLFFSTANDLYKRLLLNNKVITVNT